MEKYIKTLVFQTQIAVFGGFSEMLMNIQTDIWMSAGTHAHTDTRTNGPLIEMRGETDHSGSNIMENRPL